MSYMQLIVEALLNTYENKKGIITFLVFLSLSITGIIVIDSMIFSVSKKAENELNINGENKITVELYTPVEREKLQKIFIKMTPNISFYKELFMKVSTSPFSDEHASVTGIDEDGLKNINFYSDKRFNGNVVIATRPIHSSENIYIEGIPFEIIGVKKIITSDFLDSLGINIGDNLSSYYIPINTMERLLLSNTVTGVTLTLRNKITNNDINVIENLLKSNNIVNYRMYSHIEAKKTVDRVLSRFGLLLNVIYFVLNLSSILIIITVCWRNFQQRTTEFALKVIHGVNIRTIMFVVVLESAYVILLGLIFSIFFSIQSLSVMSDILHAELEIRFAMLGVALLLLTVTSFLSNMIFGLSFFKKSPIDIIKGRGS